MATEYRYDLYCTTEKIDIYEEEEKITRFNFNDKILFCSFLQYNSSCLFFYLSIAYFVSEYYSIYWFIAKILADGGAAVFSDKQKLKIQQFN